jgi:hypothetical protein
MQKLENQYHSKDIGLQDVPVLSQARASEEIAAVIDATIAAFFAGKAKAIGPLGVNGELAKSGNNIAHSGKARVRIAGKHPDDPKKIVYRYEETDASHKHIMTAVYNTHSDIGSVDDADGNAVKPWVHLVFEDGSQADVLAVAAPKAKKGKDADAGA